MPKLVNRVPAYRHHKASGNAFVALNGRRIYLGRYGSPESRAAYDRAIAEWLATGRRHFGSVITSAEKAITVDAIIAGFWNYAEGYYRKNGEPTSELSVLRQALRPLSALYGDTPASEFGPLALKAVREEMIRADLCRRTINNHVDRIRRVFRWAVAEGMLPPGVYQALAAVPGLRRGRSAARESDPVRPVPEADVAAVLPHLSRQVVAMIGLQLLTGMRPGEVTIMRAGDIDMTGKVWEYRPSSHKTEHHGKERVICLGPRAQEILRPFLKLDPSAYLFDPGEAEAERSARRRAARATPLWPSHIRAQESKRRRRERAFPGPSHYTRDAYRRAIQRACEKAHVPLWHPHQLRHTAATRLRREVGIEAVRVVLGHASAKVSEVYAEMDGTKARDAMERFG